VQDKHASKCKLQPPSDRFVHVTQLDVLQRWLLASFARTEGWQQARLGEVITKS
jgi:hypothetical protein